MVQRLHQLLQSAGGLCIRAQVLPRLERAAYMERTTLPNHEPTETAEEEPEDPRSDAAVDAINAGEWDAAKRAYQTILDSDPADLDAQGGLIMAGIFERTDGVSAPVGESFVDLLVTADLAAAGGEWELALGAGIKAVQVSEGADRELARTRLVEYFALAGEDPSVAPARVALANALF